MTSIRYSKELIPIRKRGAIWIMVGRPRKIGKRERNGRVSRAETKVDHVRFMEGFIADPTVIYVLDAPPLVKVGISKQPRGRVKQIQTGNGQVVRMYWYRWMDGRDAKKVEFEFHRQYQGSAGHAHGEWYYLSPASAVDRVTRKIRQLGMFSVHESFSKEVERTFNPETKRWG